MNEIWRHRRWRVRQTPTSLTLTLTPNVQFPATLTLALPYTLTPTSTHREVAMCASPMFVNIGLHIHRQVLHVNFVQFSLALLLLIRLQLAIRILTAHDFRTRMTKRTILISPLHPQLSSCFGLAVLWPCTPVLLPPRKPSAWNGT